MDPVTQRPNDPTDPTTLDLKSAWAEYKNENPKVRIRDAAAALGVSEAELVATGCGENVTRLKPDWYGLLFDLEGLGEVMALTRNNLVVHEKVGRYSEVTVMPERQMGQTLDKNIDLRIFFRNWHFGFSVINETPHGVRRSLQFFDANGVAVHKTHLRPESSLVHFDAITEKYRHDDQSPSIEVVPIADPEPELPDEEIDVDGLREDWRKLQDTHDFIFLLRKYDVTREQAFRLAGKEFAKPVDTSSFRTILEAAAEAELRIMIFVGNHGCIQIHSGPIENLREVHGWYNVLDPAFNLHARDGQFASAWVVRKPTKDDDVHSLELYDDKGDVMCYLFSKRHEGEQENRQWRSMLEDLEALG
jgi:putative hemin transport protein